MNFKFGIAVLAAASIGAFGNTLTWTIDELDTSSFTTESENPQWQYVFLTDDGTGNLTNNGTNSDDSLFEIVDGKAYGEGTWSDSSTDKTAEYVVAFWDGVQGSDYSVVKAGDTYVKVTAADWESQGPGGPNGSGIDKLTDIATSISSGDGRYTVVPEPATAALALVGVAMLVRRRK